MKKFKRIVVKVGTSIITLKSGKLNLTMIDSLVRQIVDMKNVGKEMILITSGAIGAGFGELGIKELPKQIPEKQSLAAIGQVFLIGLYNKIMREYGEIAGQILLTADDLRARDRYLNAFNTICALIDYGIIPIINENDIVVTDEIKFGDNDTLSARVASLIESDLLINLSDVKGLYRIKPKNHFNSNNIIHKVDDITDEILKMAQGKGSKVSTGGMYTKLEAAKIAMDSGITMVIAPGFKKDVIIDIINMLEKSKDYNIGTTFLPPKNRLPKRKQWFSFNLPLFGTIKVDRGAEDAIIKKRKSLLASGVTFVKGSFSSGDLVKIINTESNQIGKGLVNYSKEEIEKIKGHHSSEIFSILGYINSKEVIHKENMVLGGK